MVMIELHADNITLTLEGPRDWCKIYLVEEGVREKLGANSLDEIVPRLCYGLEEKGLPTSGKVDGIPTEHILSLSEEHGAFYIGWINQHTKILFIQDVNAHLRTKVKLDPVRRKEWVDKLKNAGVSKAEWVRTMGIFESRRARATGSKNKD